MERSITIRSIQIKRPISTGAGCHAGHVSGFVLTHFGFLSEGADLRTSMRTREREKMRFAQEIDFKMCGYAMNNYYQTIQPTTIKYSILWLSVLLDPPLVIRGGSGSSSVESGAESGRTIVEACISSRSRRPPSSRASQPTRTKPPCHDSIMYMRSSLHVLLASSRKILLCCH